ncbi:MAG TPA: ATP-binding protein, partial [Longimicrobiaceae bacterium]|nr:ATP-binding protein [Longimicrobiaceae bacterium]
RMEAVGRLAGGIAHDFNNVLTVIGSFAQLLQREVPGGSQAAHYVSEIEKAAARSTSLTRQLLAFSRQQVLKLQRLDLNEVIVDMETMLRRLIQEDILLVTRLEPELPPVRADPGQMEQVLMNLAVNARDAMPDGGRLLIETAAVELSDEDARRYPYQVNPGRYARIRISDSGTGMDADTLERIFEPFFTTKEMGHGSGLGLATVYGIVKQSGGYIWADSTPGGGTTFDVLLPVRLQELPEPGPEAAEPRPTGGSETVLLVEDEPSIRAIASHILTRQGYTVLEATDGTAALHLVDEAEGRIHLLLTDVVMPGMNGRVLAEHLQQRLPDLPVLFMSGYTADALEFYGIERGTSFLDKPFTPDSLSAAVRKVLDREG